MGLAGPCLGTAVDGAPMPMHALATTLPSQLAVESRESAVAICGTIEATMEALLQLVEAESALLRANKPVAAAAVSARQNEFAAAYIRDLELLRAIGHELEILAPDAVDRLRRLHEEFVSVLQIDMAALAAARAAAEPPRPAKIGGQAAVPFPRADRLGRAVPQRLAANARR